MRVLQSFAFLATVLAQSRGPRPSPIQRSDTCLGIPINAQCDCLDQNPLECDHCVAIVVHLGCDIQRELPIIKNQVKGILDQLRDRDLYPGVIQLSMVYFGHELRQQIPVTFDDDLQELDSIVDDLKNVVDQISPMPKANITAAMESTFELFDQWKTNFGQPKCKSKTIFLITNGHIICGPCVCRGFEMCKDYNESEEQCWEATNAQYQRNIQKLKERHQDVNVIVATPNERPCHQIEKAFGNNELANKRFSEDCFNEQNVIGLSKWRRSCWDTRSPYYRAGDCPPEAISSPKSVSWHASRTSFVDFVAQTSRTGCSAGASRAHECECDLEVEVRAGTPDLKSGCCGPRGPAGNLGPEGPRGPRGPTGSPGGQGVQGECGPSGPKGADGPRGEDGFNGPRGADGAPGQPGKPGLPGLQGKQGNDGLAGRSGLAGQPGLPGTAGLPGRPGPQGLNGFTGPDGPQGPQGSAGPAGTGIDSERYYQAYVRKLRKTVILSLQRNGQNSVFFRPLRNILQEETNRVCKCGCDFDQDNYGMCKANFSPFYKPVPSPIYRTCDVQRPPFINTGFPESTFPPSGGSNGKGFLRIEKDFGDRMMVVDNPETNNAVNMRSMSPVVSNSGPKVIRRRRKDH